jgi:hypothetical protein
MVKVTIGTDSFTAESLDALTDEQSRRMVAAYASGNAPKVETVKVEEERPFGPTNDDFRGAHVDQAAVVRIEAQHAALNAAGIKVDTKEQVAVTGTRMATMGYETMQARKVEHDAKRPLTDVAHAISTLISAENRTDVDMSARELGAGITVNGAIWVNGQKLTEQAIRGLATRLESPMLGYLLGLRDRMVESSAKEARDEDRAMMAEVLRHECKRNPDAKLRLRTRNGGIDDVYAILSPGYVPADATSILPEILDTLHGDTRATFSYDPKSTQWEVRASVWTPTPVAEMAIGEAFEGYVSLRSRDNGTSRFRGDGGVTLIRCFNASTYNAGQASVSRVHRGRVASDIAAMVRAASKSIDTLCDAWGVARRTVIRPTDAQAKLEGDAFLSALWVDMLRQKPLEAVLRGRTNEHAEGLVKAYHAERRDPQNLVRADMAQAWTRYIQGQPSDVRRDAEAAIGSWLVMS